MDLKYRIKDKIGKKSIFRALLVPLFIIMLLQAVIFYVAAVYGGIEETMNQNAADILTERLLNRKNEIETMCTKTWINLDNCEKELDDLYAEYCHTFGRTSFMKDAQIQVSFLSDVSPLLIRTLRNNGVNGIFLILNDKDQPTDFPLQVADEKIGLHIRDLDQKSHYTDVEDLLVERAPSTVIEKLGCSLDSWWEARYSFSSREDGAYYYYPLEVAWENPDVAGQDLAYFQGTHRISESDQDVVSYTIPLMNQDGYPYAVLGIELTTNYLGTLLPSEELSNSNKSCYILALKNIETGEYTPVLGSGSTFNRCFGNDAVISEEEETDTGGFHVTGRDGTVLYGDSAELEIYNNNNPFENEQLTLIALTEEKELFSYISKIKGTLAVVSLLSLFLGLCGIVLVSRTFSKPITALAQKVQTLPPQDGFTLGRLGILEIDQLVESIEELNRNASRNIARTEFFSRMSHDMRTPMNAIISFSSPELLERTSEQQKEEYLKQIHTSGEYLLGLINEVLDMTKIESNKMSLQYSSMATSRLWQTVFPIIDKLAQKNGVTFLKKISVEEATVMVDEQHLNQAVMNLLSNAVKFTPENGTVSLEVTGKTDESKPEQLQCCIIVSDNGIGMSQEFLQHLYTPFEQENESREGTGLGLSIVKKLIELMGGTIECVSKKDVGTTFTMRFALQKCDKQQEEVTEKEKQSVDVETMRKNASTVLQGKRVLVCEDHPLNTQIIVRLLERVKMEVITAENGKVGTEKFLASEEGYFDVILMDIRMPIMDGLETARFIRNLTRKDAADIPIIAMTANVFAEDVKASSEAGMNVHLAKPIEPQKLYTTLQELLAEE